MNERVQYVEDVDATVVLPTPGRRRGSFGPALEHPAAPVDLSALGGLNPLIEAANPILAAVPQIRHALRHPDPGGLKARLRDQIGAFERGARLARIPAERIEAARYALCALLDDSAAATPWGREWARGGLLAELHGEKNGADGFFQLLDGLLAAPARQGEIIEFFYVCLALGFEGRYRSGEGGRQALAQLRARLCDLLAAKEPRAAFALSTRWRGAELPVQRVPAPILLWGIASVCVLLLAGLYFAYSISLGTLSDPVARDLARLRPPLFEAAQHRPITTVATARSRQLADAIGLPEVEVGEAAGSLLIFLKADELFPSGSARLHARLEPAILKVGDVLDRVPGAIVVAGHTDDMPIRTARFPSNWELSTERARSVVTLISARIHDASRVRAEGLADSQPVAPNDSAAHRALNRRVTIMLRTDS
jgi:type VI secretion system protein ImpK